ncbi:DUF982 domain-containing protein [Sinorhizobium numidicum]|uniref:DUF982 domain-containing protein n=1 Tax=Sinorhizobium numidicum TaxID=680248 RepID=A0ABY8CNJ8_9HYPH|nr:DUF982 domain-containing protein [Sinorhizobium numidicum]WEX74214.1 DUF982 domain-containing protein [Sinorhizobium numidicum]WEX80199.1 DUF982 domain-containing protein [Sinorhizobium numidicum]
MYEMPWSKPVNVNMLDGRCRTVIGPLDAMKCLKSEWPVRNGAYYGCAIRACEAALKHKKRPEEARAAFIAASREAFLTIVAAARQEEKADGHRPLE